jgi:hypothetical protein
MLPVIPQRSFVSALRLLAISGSSRRLRENTQFGGLALTSRS